MSTNAPYPIIEPAPGILNLAPTLAIVPTGAGRILPADLPPLHFLSLADRLGELYEMVFPDRPEWLQQEAVDWADEEDVAAAVERFQPFTTRRQRCRTIALLRPLVTLLVCLFVGEQPIERAGDGARIKLLRR